MIDNIVDVYIYNNLRLMTDFTEKPTIVDRLTFNRVLPRWGIVQIRLALEDGIKEIILNLHNV